MGVAGGLESAGPVAAMAQSSCANMDNETKDTSWFSFAIAVLVICMGTVFSKLAFRAWKWIEEKIKKLENQVLGVSNELEQAQIQLADHYEYAADLNGRIEDCNALATDASNRIDTVMARQTGFEQETIEGFNALEETSNCVRYGLMEIGGFVRNAKLTAEQYRHMLTQERGNLVLWNHRNRADSTDPIVHQQEDHEGGEESPTTDVEDNQSNRPTGMEALLQNMRADQNQALAAERWHEANMIQQAICLVLDSTLTEGFSTRISNEIRNIFQRLYRFHRNRGDDERRDRFRLYVEDMQSLMIWKIEFENIFTGWCRVRQQSWNLRWEVKILELWNEPRSNHKGGVWKVVEPTHMCQDDTHKSIRELHLSFHFIDWHEQHVQLKLVRPFWHEWK